MKGFAALFHNKKLQRALPVTLFSEAVEVDTLTHNQTTFANGLEYQVTIRRLQLMTHNTEKYDKTEGVPQNVTKHYQPPLGLELSQGSLPRRQEGPMSATRWQVASDNVRDPELSYINLRRLVKKQLVKASEAAGRELWRQMLEHHRTICNPTKIMALNYLSLALVH